MLWIFLIPLLPYFVTILAISIKLINSEKVRSVPGRTVRVSVVVACRNEENNIASLIQGLISQNYPPELYQVIVVDDNSTDNTRDSVSGFNNITNLRLLSNKGSGKKMAIRTGIEASDAELIITSDADCRIGRDWIAAIVSFYTGTNSKMIIGPVVIEGREGFFQKFQELEFLSLQGITAGTAAIGDPVICNGANLAFSRDAYLRNFRNLHYEIDTGDDVFLLHSLKRENRADVRFIDSPDAIVITGALQSFSGFINQRSRWISKAGYYRDLFTIFLGIVTFAAIADIIFLIAAGFFNTSFFIILGIALLIKSLPDFIMLYEMTGRYNRAELMKWFVPSQLVYPFYVIAVVVNTMFRKDKW